MPFEIALVAPAAIFHKLQRQLRHSIKVRFQVETQDRLKTHMTWQEPDDRHLEKKLRQISRILDSLEMIDGANAEIDIHVRNVENSEPPSGSSRFSKPFQPISGLWIEPWKHPFSRSPNRPTILLDPGRAFGTGRHPSTALCLKILQWISTGGSAAKGFENWFVLDLGCGTGLLSIAAVKMGALRAVGVEIDPQAAQCAKKNVALNGLSNKIEVKEGSWKKVKGKFDLIMANLTPSVHLSAAQYAAARLRPNGWMVASGFRNKQANEMARLFASIGLEPYDRWTLDGWSAVILSRGH
jgi:ribosomal protein L11 methyltransferase